MHLLSTSLFVFVLNASSALAAPAVSTLDNTSAATIFKRDTCNARNLVREDIAWCGDYLVNLQGNPCSVNQDKTAHFCSKGGIKISGRGINNAATNVQCRDVGRKVVELLNRCGKSGGSGEVGGLVVHINDFWV